MTLTFPFCSLPILLNFLRILLWDSHKYFARHFRSLEIWDSSLCLLQMILISFLHFAMWQFDRSVRFFVYSPRRKWDILAMKMITQAYPLPPPPLPFLPLYKHVCTAFCGFDFHCESENGKCKRMLHFSLHSPSIRFYHPQWTFSICGPVRLCFRLLKWFHILFLSLSLYRSLSLSLSLLLWVHAIFAHLLRFVEHSHRCLGIPARDLFAVHCLEGFPFRPLGSSVKGQDMWRNRIPRHPHRSFVCATQS